MVQFRYIFELGNKNREYTLNFCDNWNLDLSNMVNTDWAALSFSKCEHCPLDPVEVSHCPAALAIGDIVETFKDDISFNEVTIRVITPDREYKKRTSIQVGLQSILGLIMPTSGCPRLAFLKPMARFHLPFSNFDETLVRSLSFFLLRNFCKDNKELSDFSVDSFLDSYRGAIEVNHGLTERIDSLEKHGDADQNAIIILDTFAQLLVVNLSYNTDEVKKFFVD